MLAVELHISPLDLLEAPPEVVEAMMLYIADRAKEAERDQAREANRSRLGRREVTES